MKIFYRFILIFTLAFSVIACSSDDNSSGVDPNPDVPVFLEAETQLNVSYGDKTLQVYDLYLPEGRSSETTKVIMLIHGGFWIAGDKSDMTPFVETIQQMYPDHAIVNINYVLAGLGTFAFPNQIYDIEKVINKLTSSSNELGINPEFGLIGVSAGAHLAMMYDFVYDTEDKVKFVADIVGPANFNDPFYSEAYDINMMINMLVDMSAFPEGANLLDELSPITHVSNSSSPICMFYGTTDTVVTYNDGHTLQSAFNQLGIENILKIYEGGHADNWSNEDMAEMFQIIGTYIDAYL